MEDKLIEAVRDYPCLWQVASRAYKDLCAKENAWKEVAEMVGEQVTAEDCKKRWKVLMDKFVREIKKVKQKKSGSEGPEYVSSWPHFQAMMFVSDTIKHRITSSNFGSNSTETVREEESVTKPFDETIPSFNELDEPSSPLNVASSSSVPSPATNPPTPSVQLQPKRKRNRVDKVDELLVKSLYSLQENKKARKEMDEEGHYVEQIAATLRRFTIRQKALAKMKIQELLFNIEFNPERSTPIPTNSYSGNQAMNYHQSPGLYAYNQNTNY